MRNTMMNVSNAARQNSVNPQKKPAPQTFPILALREQLRQKSVDYGSSLLRSVSRRTSYDSLPCVEYREEVEAEYTSIDLLLYTQNARKVLETCIATGAARLRYRWGDGRVTVTRFQRMKLGRVKVWGLQLSV